MIEQAIQDLYETYHWLPGGPIVPACFFVLGLMWGLSRYFRSFKYMYYFYIEHGEVIWSMDGSARRDDMEKVAKKYKLPTREYFEPHGYVTGIGIIVACTAVGTIIGTLWPVSLIVGILTIPNFVLRRVAREERNKVVFVNDLKGKK